MKALATVAILFLSLQLTAQMLPDTLSIPEIQVHSKFKVSGAGITGQTIDSLTIKREAGASLSDLLAAHTALFIKSEGRGALATVSFRGTDASHTRVYWNGMSIQSPMLGQTDLSQIPIFLLDRIVLHPGASSVTDGSGGLGGSIDLTSFSTPVNHWKISGTLSAGSYLTFNNYLCIQNGNRHFQTATRLYYNRSKNDFPFYNKNIADIDPKTGEYIYPKQRNEHADYLLDGWLQEFVFHFKKKYLLNLNYWYQYSTRALPRLNTYEGDDHANLSREQQPTHRATIHFTSFGKNGRTDVHIGFQAQNMTYEVQNQIGGMGYYDAVYSVSKTTGSYNKVTYTWNKSKKTLLKAGYQFNYEHVNTRDSVSRTGYCKNRATHDLIFSWQQMVGKHFSSMVFLRKEWIQQNALPLIPYFGFNWVSGRQQQWLIQGNITRNYHYPSLNDLYWQPGGNPDLRPEKGISSALGLVWEPQIKNIIWKTHLSLFYNDITDWILWTPSPLGYWSPENIEHVISRGVEIQLHLNFSYRDFRFFIRAGYAYTKSTNEGNHEKWGDASIGKQIPYVPVHSGNFTGEVQWHHFFITWVNTSYSERYTTSSEDLTLRDRLYPYFMNDVYAGKTFKLKSGEIGLQLKVYNLFNEDYRSVLGRPMPGRNYLLMLTFKP